MFNIDFYVHFNGIQLYPGLRKDGDCACSTQTHPHPFFNFYVALLGFTLLWKPQLWLWVCTQEWRMFWREPQEYGVWWR